jgi:hypothetical protein
MLHRVTLGVRVVSWWCLLLLEVATFLTAWWRDLRRSTQGSLCGAPEKFVRGVVFAPREPRRATLVERDTNSDKWSDRI